MLGLVILFPLLAHFPGNIKYLVYLFMIFLGCVDSFKQFKKFRNSSFLYWDA